MEQRLDGSYLRPGLVERTVAPGIGAVGLGTGIHLAAWGISFLWRYTPSDPPKPPANVETSNVGTSAGALAGGAGTNAAICEVISHGVLERETWAKHRRYGLELQR
jgi:hypothetical protein